MQIAYKINQGAGSLRYRPLYRARLTRKELGSLGVFSRSVLSVLSGGRFVLIVGANELAQVNYVALRVLDGNLAQGYSQGLVASDFLGEGRDLTSLLGTLQELSGLHAVLLGSLQQEVEQFILGHGHIQLLSQNV